VVEPVGGTGKRAIAVTVAELCFKGLGVCIGQQQLERTDSDNYLETWFDM